MASEQELKELLIQARVQLFIARNIRSGFCPPFSDESERPAECDDCDKCREGFVKRAAEEIAKEVQAL